MAWRRWGEAVARLREPVRRAECAVLFFPVAVTVLAAVALLCGGRVAAWQWWAAAAAAFVWLALTVAAIGGRTVLYVSILIAQAETMREVLRAAPPKVLCNYGGLVPLDLSERQEWPTIDPATFGDRFRIALLNLRLLSRQEPALKGAEVRRIRPEEVETLPSGPNGEFRMGPDYDPAEWSGWTRNAANPSRLARYLNYPALVLRTYFVSLPRNVLARLGGLLPGR